MTARIVRRLAAVTVVVVAALLLTAGVASASDVITPAPAPAPAPMMQAQVPDTADGGLADAVTIGGGVLLAIGAALLTVAVAPRPRVAPRLSVRTA
ncbi:MAG TPA: hypothetical protein VEA78_12130 [Acidimicrobiales bacterium]|nr:hypothetical protein [Acidimicrobiales bacterium]